MTRAFDPADLTDYRTRSPYPIVWALLSGKGLDLRWVPDSLAQVHTRTVQPDLVCAIEHAIDPAAKGVRWSLFNDVALVEPVQPLRGGPRVIRGAKHILLSVGIHGGQEDRFAALDRPVAIVGNIPMGKGLADSLSANAAARLSAAWMMWSIDAKVPPVSTWV